MDCNVSLFSLSLYDCIGVVYVQMQGFHSIFFYFTSNGCGVRTDGCKTTTDGC